MKQIILAGGFGRRVFHILNQPKQFARIVSRGEVYHSTFMLAVERAYRICDDEIIIIVNSCYIDIAIEQLGVVVGCDFKRFIVLAEYQSYNTLYAIHSALLFVKRNFGSDDEKILIIPADHVISPFESYKNDILKGLTQLKIFNLFGMEPKLTRDSVNYGNIFCERYSTGVIKFLEKPTIEQINLVDRNLTHYWNSGIFLIDNNGVLQKFEKLANYKNIIEIKQYENADNFNFPIEKIFFINIIGDVDLLKLPFDFFISENLSDVSVTKANFEWTDIGSAETLNEIMHASHSGVCSSVG